MPTHFLLAVVVALQCALSVSCRAVEPSVGRPIATLYPPAFYPITKQLGLFSVGLAFVDMDGDGDRDLILSSGTDYAAQSLTIYLRTEQFYSQLPNVISSGSHAHTRLAAGDINGDGLNDIAVALYEGPFHRQEHGGVRVYFGQGSIDRQHQRLQGHNVGQGYQGMAVQMADIDADGDLDLIVAVQEEPGSEANLGPGRIYLNREGSIDLTPWASSALGALNVKAVDLDNDGWVDLIFRGPHLHVFFGKPTAADSVPYSTTPDWTSGGPPESLAYGLDVGPVGADKQISVVSSSAQGVRVYRPTRGGPTNFVWDAPQQGKLFSVRSVDVNDDGLPDLIGASWGSEPLPGKKCAIPAPVGGGCYGGPVVIFSGTDEAFETSPAYTSTSQTTLTGMAIADLLGTCTVEGVETFETGSTRSVFTLEEYRIQSIDGVTLDGVELPSALAHLTERRYLVVPGTNWISITPPVTKGHKVEIRYQSSPKVDITVATSDPTKGTWHFPSGLSCPSSGRTAAKPKQDRGGTHVDQADPRSDRRK